MTRRVLALAILAIGLASCSDDAPAASGPKIDGRFACVYDGAYSCIEYYNLPEAEEKQRTEWCTGTGYSVADSCPSENAPYACTYREGTVTRFVFLYGPRVMEEDRTECFRGGGTFETL